MHTDVKKSWIVLHLSIVLDPVPLPLIRHPVMFLNIEIFCNFKNS